MSATRAPSPYFTFGIYTWMEKGVKKSAGPRGAICELRDEDPLTGAIPPSFLEEDQPCIGIR